jgi:hypothetical protein
MEITTRNMMNRRVLISAKVTVAAAPLITNSIIAFDRPEINI